MSDTIAKYSFLPWLRQGLSNSITQSDHDNSVKLRASIPIHLQVSATKNDGTAAPEEPVDKIVELYGPGDIVGIDSKAIVKTEPRNWITNFEPNFLPFIEFYEEDFPWRYTPARPAGERLRPWLTLVVLKEDEFENGANIKDKPLPFFVIKEGKEPAALFPKPTELWAWAHVHANKELAETEVTNLITQDPDNAYSRIISPRKLETNIAYHAFLIPTFESGRLAGLGRDMPDDLAATKCAWEDVINVEFPYYHRWYFRTGNIGDFEYLVRILEPKPADKRVGVRDIDVIHPGSNLPGIDDPELQGVLKLGGALRVPFDTMEEEDQQQVKKYDEWDEHPYPHPFTEAMARRVNLADDYTDENKVIEDVNKEADIVSETDPEKGDPDPVITSPLYGRWHAIQQRLLKDKNGADLPNNKNWVHELNLDPRFRVAAGLGTKVVQKGQEEYMQSAWEQVGDIIEANNRLRFAQLAEAVSLQFYSKHITPLQVGKAFTFTAPVQKRILYQNLTVSKQVEDSLVPAAVSAGAFRSVTRPRGSMMKKMALPANAGIHQLVDKINSGSVIIVPPIKDPTGGINLNDPAVTEAAKPKNVPSFIEELLRKYKWFKYLPLILLVLVLLIMFVFFLNIIGAAVVVVIGAGLVSLYNQFKKWGDELKKQDSVLQDSQFPEAVKDYPMSPDFVLSEPGSGVSFKTGDSDSREASNLKVALQDGFTYINIKYPDPVRTRIDLGAITGTIISSLDPAVTIQKRILTAVKIPGRLRDKMVEKFAPVMAYPEIEIPMYKPLADISSELFLPNINLIEQNSITLLENNQKFIESYMVGINHEMSRELLWREYPTDQRGSYFRQFWDVTSFLPPQPVATDIKEKLRDIPKIHTWSRINTEHTDPSDPTSPLKNELGQHNQRALESGKTQLVLVVRGELLKKYPTAVIYAHKADWGLNDDEVSDVNEERRFIELTDAEKTNPPLTKIKTPLFEAKVEPDIYFFGFDLDDEEARGTPDPTSTSQDPGWFFVIKERPGEPRFGLDIDKATNENGVERFINWNNLSWKDIETPEGSCIELNKTMSFQIYDEGTDQENKPNPDDIQARWSPDTNAAELAYILYQVPVLIGVHASKMLPD